MNEHSTFFFWFSPSHFPAVSPIGQDFGSFGGSGNNNVREYDSMKDQFDEAMTEISSLKRQYIDSKRRCDSAQERLEYYREQYTAAMNQLETAVQESSSLRANFAKSNSEKIRYDLPVSFLWARENLYIIFCNKRRCLLEIFPTQNNICFV